MGLLELVEFVVVVVVVESLCHDLSADVRQVMTIFLKIYSDQM